MRPLPRQRWPRTWTHPLSASRPPRSAFLVLRAPRSTRLGRAQSSAGWFLGAAFQRLQHLRYVIAAARHHFVGENDAAGLVGTAGRNERSDQAAKQAADRCLRARARNSRRARAAVGRGRSAIMLVSKGFARVRILDPS